MEGIPKQAAMLSLALLLSCSWEPADAFAEDRGTETVKVGYYEDGDYMSCNPQGEYAGYNIEFLQELSKQSGLQFEIVDAGSWNAAYSMLVDGEIDLLPSVYYDPERAKEVSFVAQPMCTIYTTLNVRMDDDRYNYEDFEAFSGMNVGIIRGGIDGERFKEFCHEHQVELNIEEYDETELLLSALDDGILDGVAITHLGKNSTFRSVAQFAPSPLFFAVNAEDTELLNDLNRTMDSILLSNPSYETDLYDKYLAPSSNQKPVFTKEELQYIQQGKTVVVAYEPSFAPLSYREEKTGEFKGVTADIFKFIAENSGLIFQFEAHPQNEALELLQQGKVDVLCLTDGDYLWDRKNKFNSTLYYLRTPTSMITRYGAGKPEKLALPQGYQLSETVAKDNPDCEIRYYPSAQACLDAVQNREADAAYLNTQVGGFLMDGARYRGMNEAALGQYTNKMCAGISLSADPRLFSIMNKCIQYLPVEQVDAFLVANSVDAKKISLAEFAGQHIWAVVCGVCLMLGIVILLISYNLRNALRSNRRIQELLYKDDLTGLDNINGFYKKWMAEAEDRKGKNFVLLYGDICQFKLINDNFGFAAGDQVLCACGRTFQEKVKEGENCIRVSADNFVLLLQYDTWESLVKRLKAAVENLDIWRREHTKLPYKIDMVFGVYLINETEDMKINQMLDFANYARRHAKETPGCFACLYDEQMRKDAILALQLEGELEAALNRNDFVVYYQPKVSMKDGHVVGSEALVRWNHSKRGFLMPGTFIPLFEKNGAVRKIDFWLLEDVCKTMRKWEDQGIGLLPVSCNFSRLHFQQPDFPERICETVDRWKISHDLLEIEITESALTEESGIIKKMLTRLKELGFKIAIDDFGSGYSSLGQLRQLPADVLKLDRSFVCHGVAEKREQIVVEHTIRMAEELGMKVICEGVENEMQVDMLGKIGCRYAQGFYYYRPMKREDFDRILRNQEILRRGKAAESL